MEDHFEKTLTGLLRVSMNFGAFGEAAMATVKMIKHGINMVDKLHSQENKKVRHLAYHSKKHRVRKKNQNRLKKEFIRNLEKINRERV